MAFRINDDEWNALHDEPPHLFKFYCAIRRCMDYQNRMAGLKTRINSQYFAEVMTYTQRAGRKAGKKIARSQIRWWINSLEDLGLIKHRGNYVFECVLADTEESVQKRSVRGTARSTALSTTEKIELEALPAKDLLEEVQPDAFSSYPSRHNPPPESGISLSHNKNYDLSKPQSFDSCPHQKIISLYHEKLPTLPRVSKWTATRAEHLRARWREHPSLELWEQFFSIVSESKFLTGRITTKDGRSFRATLDWLVKPENFAKTLEGKYDNK